MRQLNITNLMRRHGRAENFAPQKRSTSFTNSPLNKNHQNILQHARSYSLCRKSQLSLWAFQ